VNANREPEAEVELDRLRFKFSKWALVCIMGTTAILLFSLFFVIMLSDEYRHRLVMLILDKVPVTIGVPFCGAMAMFVVLLLRATQGPVEFEAAGMKFRGASGPIVMWVLCFIAAIAATKLLWT
jgi:hypothetical protein